MSLVKQLAPRWKLNAVILQANAPLSVLLPVKNGSDKIPAVSIALEIWIALNGGKQTVLLLYFLQSSPKITQRGLMELDRLLARFLFCIAGLLSEPLIPAAFLACTGEAKKAWIPDPGECPALSLNVTSSRFHSQTLNFHPNFSAFQGVSEHDEVHWENKSLGTEGRCETTLILEVNLVDSLWPILSPFLPIWGLPASQPGSQTPFLPGLLFHSVLFLSSLGPRPRWNHKKEQELSPITAKSLFCKWSLVAKWKVQHILQSSGSVFGSRTKYFHNTDQNYSTTQPKEKPAHHQISWLVTSGLCEVFGVMCAKLLLHLPKRQ